MALITAYSDFEESDDFELIDGRIDKISELCQKPSLSTSDKELLRGCISGHQISANFGNGCFYNHCLKNDNVDALGVLLEFCERDVENVVRVGISKRSYKCISYLSNRYDIDLLDYRNQVHSIEFMHLFSDLSTE
jgi:hypothetical protein